MGLAADVEEPLESYKAKLAFFARCIENGGADPPPEEKAELEKILTRVNQDAQQYETFIVIVNVIDLFFNFQIY